MKGKKRHLSGQHPRKQSYSRVNPTASRVASRQRWRTDQPNRAAKSDSTSLSIQQRLLIIQNLLTPFPKLSSTVSTAPTSVQKLPGSRLTKARFDFESSGSCLVSVLGSARKLWPLIIVSNKVSLQNQLQNLCARNPKEFNEAFDYVIRW